MNKRLNNNAGGLVLVVSLALAGCATPQKPPRITLDEPVAATLLPEPERPMEIVEVQSHFPCRGNLYPCLARRRVERKLKLQIRRHR